ncbi:sensor histidine kinase [Diaminobutyricibacter tongyongensis]|nr:HAMP domain-containing sensor histidine kinase [Diaminobutyricibacter tongyongensis]
MGGRDAVVDSDTRAVRRASRFVGLWITIASGALVIAAIGAAFFFILDQLRPSELGEKPLPGEHKIYIDTTEAMIAFVAVGVLAVAIAGVLSLVITRRAVLPLGRALRIQRTFVQDASHELRTPLAVLDARLQILQRSLDEHDPSRETVEQLREDARTLIEIVNDLLLAADADENSSSAGPVPVEPAVRSAVDAMAVLAAPRNIDIAVTTRFDDGAAAATRVPETSLQRCVTALLDNAVTHSPNDTTIRVQVTAHKHDVAISVADEGTGITGIEPRRIFDRFAHAAPTAAAAPPRASFGIGLALVRDIATRHGGTVDVAETSPDGTTLVLTLPRA